MRVSYVGSSGIQLSFRRDLNRPRASTTPFSQSLRPWPYLRNVFYLDRGASSSYNAFEMELTRRMSKGLSLNAHYTWLKNLTNSQHDSVEYLIEDAYDRTRERGNDQLSPPHRFVVYGLWEIPVGRGSRFLTHSNSVVDTILGGWTLFPMLDARSDVWLTPYFSGQDISNTNITSGRPDRTGNGNYPGDKRALDNYFDASAFARPPGGVGRFGNAGVGIIEGPGSWGANLGIYKYFRLPRKEGLNLRLEVQIVNLFNHPQFQITPNDTALNITSPSVGRVTTVGAQPINMSQTEFRLLIWVFGLRGRHR